MRQTGRFKLFSFGSSALPVEAAPDIPVADPQADAAQAAAQREAVLGEALDLFEKDVLRVVGSLSSGISVAKEKSTDAADRLSEVASSIASLVHSADQINAEVNGVSSSTSELSATAEEIAVTVSQARERSAATALSAASSATEARKLEQDVTDIGTLLSSISEIATHTNLLALNATIEAARAGDAGKGFAVVAQEVKALSVAAAQSVAMIRQRMETLQASSSMVIGNMQRICQEIGEVAPIYETISHAATEQRATIAELAMRLDQTNGAVASVTDAIRTISEQTQGAHAISEAVATESGNSALEAGNLGRRVVTLMRSISAVDRRRSERFPIDLAIRIKSVGDWIPARSFDLSEGGLLLRPSERLHLAAGNSYEAEIGRVGNVMLRVVNISELGAHCAFVNISPDAAQALDRVIEGFHAEHRPLVERSTKFAAEIVAAIEDEITQKRLGLSDVFDTDYKIVSGTDPVQLTTLYLERFDIILPAIFERTLALDPKMVFCLAIDRNGYIPVHNRKFSHPQREGDRAYNAANSRNRRIFDDRAGLLAARLMQPSRIQTYNRDMGNGVHVQMKEVDAPLMVLGRHWGGVRVAYTL